MPLKKINVVSSDSGEINNYIIFETQKRSTTKAVGIYGDQFFRMVKI
jgi:hypothetical protein